MSGRCVLFAASAATSSTLLRVTNGLDDPPAKLADLFGRAIADKGDGEAGYADWGDEAPPAEAGLKEVCRNLGTSFPKSLDVLREALIEVDVDTDAAALVANPKAISELSWI